VRVCARARARARVSHTHLAGLDL